MLAPFLGKPYGEALRDGELKLPSIPQDGRIFLDYYDNRFPINPRDYTCHSACRGRRAGRSRARLCRHARPTGTACASGRGSARNPAPPRAWPAPSKPHSRPYHEQTDAGRDLLHRLLDQQNFRLAWWRAASDEINWRRFFDVNALAGLRAELASVFEASHETILRLYSEGLIDGVRVDHVDGLADPRSYCRKLRRRLKAAGEARPHAAPRSNR